MDELKPCPFCGSTVHNLDTVLGVGCNNSDCSMWALSLTSDKWNTRPLEDTLRKQLEVAKEAMENMELILSDGDGRENIHAPGDELVEAICERIGYGFVMDAAARLWTRKDSNGAFICGPTRYMFSDARGKIRNALTEIERIGGSK